MVKKEHRELAHDIAKVFISFTVISGLVGLYRFIDKWFLKRVFATQPQPQKALEWGKGKDS